MRPIHVTCLIPQELGPHSASVFFWATAQGGVADRSRSLGVSQTLASLPGTRSFSAFVHPFPDGPYSTWDIEKTQEKTKKSKHLAPDLFA